MMGPDIRAMGFAVDVSRGVLSLQSGIISCMH